MLFRSVEKTSFDHERRVKDLQISIQYSRMSIPYYTRYYNLYCCSLHTGDVGSCFVCVDRKLPTRSIDLVLPLKAFRVFIVIGNINDNGEHYSLWNGFDLELPFISSLMLLLSGSKEVFLGKFHVQCGRKWCALIFLVSVLWCTVLIQGRQIERDKRAVKGGRKTSESSNIGSNQVGGHVHTGEWWKEWWQKYIGEVTDPTVRPLIFPTDDDFVNRVVDKSMTKVRIMYEELQTVGDPELFKNHYGNSPAARGSFACETQADTMRPGWAQESVSGDWMVIINTDLFPQKVRTESCSRPNEPCSFISPYYDSTCQQRYSLHRLLAVYPHDPNRSPVVALFKFPAGCSCRVDPVRKNDIEQRKIRK
ncbi:neurotrophin 1 [Trichonephila inaurata madagascariensis]|uniref:Neurotrophin 1 n=1 Tax=Trichonephila inaurata madagascariensis TaxID=2747483 RepID=A0A8X6XUT7_9ARAC|nr:neurotrophin 1 [Trichonephila inaurata madagascariensis]